MRTGGNPGSILYSQYIEPYTKLAQGLLTRCYYACFDEDDEVAVVRSRKQEIIWIYRILGSQEHDSSR